jgi:hypothetical protein
MYDLRHPFSRNVAEQLFLGRDSSITTLGALEQHEIGVLMSNNLARRLRSIQIVANVYEVACLDRDQIYEESVEGPLWWPDNPHWPELALTAKDLMVGDADALDGFAVPRIFAERALVARFLFVDTAPVATIGCCIILVGDGAYQRGSG